MAIHRPGTVLLRSVPLSFVADKVAGGKSKPLDAAIPLVPFIDFLIVLVVFLLTSFGASGELRSDVRIPSAHFTDALDAAPIVTIDARAVTLDGHRVASTPSLLADATDTRIADLVSQLDVLRENWRQLHPGQPFTGALIVEADERTDFRVLKKTLASAAQAGFGNVSFAVAQR